MDGFFDNILLQFGDINITLGKVLLALFFLFLLSVVYWLLAIRLLSRQLSEEVFGKEGRRKAHRLTRTFFILLGLLAILLSLGLDQTLVEGAQANLKISTLLQALLVWQFARLLDFLFSTLLLREETEAPKIKKPEVEHSAPGARQRANRTVQLIVYVLALLFILYTFDIDYPLFDFESKGQQYQFKISNILIALFILLMARMISWIIIQLMLRNYYQRKSINLGSQYAINQLLKYFIYVVALLMALEALGFKLTVLWGGAAALLVGVGLGLQETFKDFFSGIILLFERTVEVGDVVQVDGLIGTVRRIGLRTSMVETRDNITVIVPNSRLVVEKVINWSHNDNKARFFIKVGVAYGSDTELVRKLLVQVARENAYVIRHPPPFVRFVDFGNSSLDFEIHFWSHEFTRIEDVKSDIRFEIDQAFRQNGVTIPFPQRDVWMKGK